MADEGWTTTIEADGGVVGEYSDAQASAFLAASDRCSEKNATKPREATEADFEAIYPALLELRDCIIGEGYPLPSAPSYQVFRDGGGGWSPYLDIAPIPNDEMEVLQGVCLQPVVR